MNSDLLPRSSPLKTDRISTPKKASKLKNVVSFESFNEKVQHALIDQNRSLQEQLETSENERFSLEEKLKSTLETLEQLQREKSRKLHLNEQNMWDLEVQNETLSMKIDEIQARLDKLLVENKHLSLENAKLLENQSVKPEVEPTDYVKDRLLTEKMVLNRRITELTKEIESLNQKIKELEAINSELKQFTYFSTPPRQHSVRSSPIKSIHASPEKQINSSLNIANSKICSLEKDLEFLTVQRQELQDLLQDAKAEIASLQNELEAKDQELRQNMFIDVDKSLLQEFSTTLHCETMQNSHSANTLRDSKQPSNSVSINSKSDHLTSLVHTMVGSWFQKYNRHGKKPRLRYFWVNPYSKTLNWSHRPPSKKSITCKSVFIRGISWETISEKRILPPSDSIIISIITPSRTIQIIPTSWSDFDKWTEGITQLLANPFAPKTSELSLIPHASHSQEECSNE